MKRILIVVIASLFVFFVSSAYAVDLSQKPITYNVDHSSISELPDNIYSKERPLIIFFPGSGECFKIEKAWSFIKKYELYEYIDCDLLAVSVNTGHSKVSRDDWDSLAESLVEWINDRYEDLSDSDKFPIIVDCVSYGGVGGTYFVNRALKAGIWVDEINYLDAACTDTVTISQLEKYLNKGIWVNVYACTSGAEVSVNGRNLIDYFDGERYFYGKVLKTDHGRVLHDAIYEDGLHSTD